MKGRPLAAAAALAALILARTSLAQDASAPQAAEISAVPQVISLLQVSLRAPGTDISGLPAPLVDSAKAAAFLNRAQAVAQDAASHPLSVPALPASALTAAPRKAPDPAAAEAEPVPPEARQVVLGAVGAALDGLSEDEIERMPPEQVARLSRRIFEEVAGSATRPTALSEDVIDRLRTLSPQARARMGRYLGQAYDLLTGHGGAPVGKGASATPLVHCLQRETADRMPSEPPAAKESLAHEIMRLLDDSEGPDGFNHFVVTMALDAYIEAEAAGRLRTGERTLTLVDPRDGTTEHDITVRGMPVIPEHDLAGILDRRLRAYGLDAGRLGLEGPDVPVSRFVDAFQHLYLADRLANARLNGFRGDVLPAFLTSREPLDSARKVMASRRSPCSPRHVHNLLRLLFQIP